MSSKDDSSVSVLMFRHTGSPFSVLVLINVVIIIVVVLYV